MRMLAGALTCQLAEWCPGTGFVPMVQTPRAPATPLEVGQEVPCVKPDWAYGTIIEVPPLAHCWYHSVSCPSAGLGATGLIAAGAIAMTRPIRPVARRSRRSLTSADEHNRYPLPAAIGVHRVGHDHSPVSLVIGFH